MVSRYDPAIHDVSAFDCGQDALNRWLRHSAGQSQRRDAARTFVATAGERRVIGYYTAVAAELHHESASPSVRRGMSRHFPISVALIARLAVDSDAQGQGVGALLLTDALTRVLAADEHVAMRAVAVHAMTATAATFYERFGFKPLADEPRTLIVTLHELRRSREQP
ncbi:MAG: GNAT family N-acetyltransferase [Actinobacteria bacterium]|nr:GNAT family N-acetyltransferase [Actinomycetota bacterium]